MNLVSDAINRLKIFGPITYKTQIIRGRQCGLQILFIAKHVHENTYANYEQNCGCYGNNVF